MMDTPQKTNLAVFTSYKVECPTVVESCSHPSGTFTDIGAALMMPTELNHGVGLQSMGPQAVEKGW